MVFSFSLGYTLSQSEYDRYYSNREPPCDGFSRRYFLDEEGELIAVKKRRLDDYFGPIDKDDEEFEQEEEEDDDSEFRQIEQAVEEMDLEEKRVEFLVASFEEDQEYRIEVLSRPF